MKAWQWFPRELCWPAASPPGWARPRRRWSGTGLRCCAGRPGSWPARRTGPVVVVRAPGQDLPDLPKGTVVVEDPREGKGPVQGIAAGLTALSGQAETAFVASTDMPFLHPAFVRRVLRVLEQDGHGRGAAVRPRVQAAAGGRLSRLARGSRGAPGQGGPAAARVPLRAVPVDKPGR